MKKKKLNEALFIAETKHMGEAILEALDTITTPAQSSKGIKYDGGKTPLNLLSTYAMEEVGEVLAYGAKKYAPWNWAEGIVYSRVLSAAKRHLSAWENRENHDIGKDCKACESESPCTSHSGRHHLANTICNLMFLLDYELRELKHLDDRRPEHTLKKGSK